LCGALNLVGSADDACVVADDYGLLSFVALHFLKLEYSDRANINTDTVTIALVVIDYDADHDLTPVNARRV
jgi:hypothetical protein